MTLQVREALDPLVRARRDHEVVVTHQGAARVWPRLTQHPLDFHHNPSTMGGGVPLALGIALARPDHHVIAVTGDGSLLMSLGCLVTVISTGCRNLTVVVLDNGLYEVTGGQQTPAAPTELNYVGIARSVGFPAAVEFDDASLWRGEAAAVLSLPGPRFIALRVAPADPADMQTKLGPMPDQVKRLTESLDNVSRRR